MSPATMQGAPGAPAGRPLTLPERQALVQQLQANMPQDMRALPQWLLWRFVAKPGAAKPAKVPFYANGQLRGWPKGKPRDGKPTAAQPQVDQGHELDRAALCSFDDVCRLFVQRPGWAGVGFAFLPGDGLVGVDIDHAISRDSGEISELCDKVVGLCASYTETSPSGTGVHIILRGECGKFKCDRLGLEVYAGSQYFACTGARWQQMPEQAQPADPLVLDYLRTLVEESRAAVAAEKEAARAAVRDAAPAAPAPEPAEPPAAAAQAAAPTSSPSTPPGPPPAAAQQPVRAVAVSSVGQHRAPGQQGSDFRAVNDAALLELGKWVPDVFAKARPWAGGYRVTSKDLGRDLQEDLQLLPAGIMDFGEEQGMSAIDVVCKWMPGMARPVDAMRWLAGRIGVQLAPPPRRTPVAGAAAQAAGGADVGHDEPPSAGPRDDVPDELPAEAPADAADSGNVVSLESKRARAPKRGKGGPPPQAGEGAEDDAAAAGRPARKVPKETWELVDALCARYALVYSTDQAWDKLELMLVRIPSLRLAWGKTAVNLWLSRPAPARVMIRPVDLVFEPGADVSEPAINMFAGLDLEPQACTAEEVAPMLRLLRHLCSESALASGARGSGAGKAEDVDAVMHWVLCWMAVPLQKLGTKMQTACVFHGAQGTGKNLFWDMWRDLYGTYGITVGQTELEDKFNGWVSRKLAILGDEVVSRQEMYHNKNRLKLVVTQQDKFPIRGMNMETRWESNHANVVFLSNESQPLALEERDRRYLVVYTPLEADVALYEAVKVFKASGGAAKWLHYLQHYPVGDFNAHTKPVMTHAKEDLIQSGWRPSVRFVHEWLEGFQELPLRVCSAEQLYRAFRRWCDRSGAKWPPEQSMFTAEVNRWLGERVKRGEDGRFSEPALRYKVLALPADPGRARRTVRCWLPSGTGLDHVVGPPDGMTEGQWALESIESFERDLRAFCGHSVAEDEK